MADAAVGIVKAAMNVAPRKSRRDGIILRVGAVHGTSAAEVVSRIAVSIFAVGYCVRYACRMCVRVCVRRMGCDASRVGAGERRGARSLAPRGRELKITTSRRSFTPG